MKSLDIHLRCRYPYTLSSWTTRNGAVAVADLSGVAPKDDRIHEVAMVCHSPDRKNYYVDGTEFPMWPNVPYWIRRLVWRYRVWHRSPVKG